MTPSLPAAQPAKYTLNGQTVRPLGQENDKGFALINALSAAQQKHAILSYDVKDLVLGPGNDGKVIQPEGILPPSWTRNNRPAPRRRARMVSILNDEAAAEMAKSKQSAKLTSPGAEARPTGSGYYRWGRRSSSVCAAARRRQSHPHNLPRSNQRLRRETR
jgi:hypothetical protein